MVKRTVNCDVYLDSGSLLFKQGEEFELESVKIHEDCESGIFVKAKGLDEWFDSMYIETSMNNLDD